jgi:prolyl 4-hydroxylase
VTEATLTMQAARAAYGWRRQQSWSDALSLLAAAAAAGEPDAQRQFDLVTQADIETLLRPPSVTRLSKLARIGAARGFAPPGFAEWLIERAAGQLEPAPVNDAIGGAVRTAQAFAFGPEQRDVILAVMQERAARIIGAPVAFHEPPNAISYEVGQEFRAHADFIEPSIPQFQPELRLLGQRTATIVTYLNSDFDGAETWFPDAGVKFRGDVGDAIVFANVLPNGTPDYNTKHAGLPVLRGRKWVLSQWIRAKPFPFPEEASP